MNLKKKIEECSTTTNPSKLRKVKLEMKEEIDNSTNSSMDSELFLCDNDTNSENVDDDLIYSNNVSDRRLFYEATEGDLYKYKYSVELVDPASPHRVWVGVTAKTHPIKHYITTKDHNGKLSTIFHNHRSKYVVMSACTSFLRHNDPNHDGVLPEDPLHFSVVDVCLIITNMMNQLHPVSLTKEAVIQYIDKECLLQRFTKFLHNKLELIKYGDNILTTNTSHHTSRREFDQRWLNPPNRTLTSDNVWDLLKKNIFWMLTNVFIICSLFV